MKPGYKFLVSTDVAGPFAGPARWKLLWGEATQLPQFAGFEMLAWGLPRPFWIRSLLEQAKKLDLNVVGIHGRVGYKENQYKNLQEVLAYVQYNEFFLPTDLLVRNFDGVVPYILFHSLELTNVKNFEAITSKIKKSVIMVENGYGTDKEIGNVLTLALCLQKAGLKSGVTFDLYHYFVSLSDQTSGKKWIKTLACLDSFIKQAQKQNLAVNVHLPLGERVSDSLPDEIDKSMLSDLAAIIKNRIWYLVVEDQPNNDALLLPGKKATQRLIVHNHKILDRLQEANLIS